MIKPFYDTGEKQCSELVDGPTGQALRERNAWLTGQKLAFQAAMKGESPAVSLGALVNTVIAHTNGEARAAFYTKPANAEGLYLVVGMTDEYAKDVNGFKIGPESLACGLVMHTGEPAITPDVEDEPLWASFLHTTRKHNYRACWSFPVRTEGGPVLGTLAIYFVQPREPEPAELEMAGILAHSGAVIMSLYKEAAERANAEKVLRESEVKCVNETARMQATLKSISDAVYIGDASGITLANRAALDQLGYSDFDELNRNIGTLAAEIQTRDAETNEIISPEQQAFARALAGEHVTRNVKVRHRQNGGERILRSAASPVIVDGKILAAVAVNTDITEQWQTAAALHESEHKLRELNQTLEAQVAERTAQLSDSNALLNSVLDTSSNLITVLEAVRDRSGEIINFKYLLTNNSVYPPVSVEEKTRRLYGDVHPGMWRTGAFKQYCDVIASGERADFEVYYDENGMSEWFRLIVVKLGDGILITSENITKRKQTEQQLRESRETLQHEIFKATLDTQEEERRRIAESLHNGLGQVLYGAKLSLGNLFKSDLSGSDVQSLKNSDKLLNDAIAQSRRLSHELMPVILEDFGLEAIVRDICRQFSNDIKFKCTFKGKYKLLDKRVEIAIYRIIQELMMNIVKHAEATEALVVVEIRKSHINLLVHDNGRGFDVLSVESDGIGLKTIRNKINLLSGNIGIVSNKGTGTAVSINIPIKTNA